jgi:hypothetical protein
MGKIRSVYKTWIGEPERKRPLRIFIRRWQDNIKKELKK